MPNKRIRVLHLPTTVGGNAQSLSRHLCDAGFLSESWALQDNYLGYRADKFICRPDDNPFMVEIKRLFALSYVFRFDVIFFNFGSTLFSPRASVPRTKKSLFTSLVFPLWRLYTQCMQAVELWLLRKLDRQLFVQYQGDDARQGDYCRRNFDITAAHHVEAGYYSHASDLLKRRQIASLTAKCCKTYALNPDLLRVLPPRSEFLPYSHISLVDWSPRYTQTEARPLRIGHAPSHRRVKGTDIFLEALDKLKCRHPFELVLIEGRSHAEAKQLLETVDLFLDQLLIGWYGGVAVEAMALGKPVVAYIRDEDLDFIPTEMRQEMPIINACPRTLEAKLEEVLSMPRHHLLEIARRSRLFVERWHDPATIANRVGRDILESVSN